MAATWSVAVIVTNRDEWYIECPTDYAVPYGIALDQAVGADLGAALKGRPLGA